MPKKIEGVNEGKLTTSLDVPQPAEPRVAADIERPVRVLLNNIMYLFKLVQDVAGAIATHAHDLVTEAKAGFMSPGDKQKLDGLSTQLATHAHAIATTLAPGFMSKEDKVKLNGIEAGAQVVNEARVVDALGIRVGRIVLPGSAFAAGQEKAYTANVRGALYDAPIIGSETTKGDFFLISYHVDNNKVVVGIQNMTTKSVNFPGGEAQFVVFNNLAPDPS